MRLLVWASTYGNAIGGGPVLAQLLLEALAQRGHEIVVVTDRRPSTLAAEEFRNGVHIIRLPVKGALASDHFALRQRVAALKRELRPTLVYVFSSGYCELLHHETAQVEPAPLLVTLHDSFPENHYHPNAIVGRNLRAASWVSACSVSVLDTARRHVPVIVPISSVVLNAIPAPSRSVGDACFDPPVLLYVGRLVELKGVDLLISAFVRLSECFPDIRLDIAGDGVDAGKLKSMADSTGVGDRIQFLGGVERSAVFDLMANASIVVVPSRIEPFGLVALEAAHMSRPVVASAVGGLPEVIVDNATGLLVSPKDPTELAEALASLIGAPDRARNLGAAARRRALEVFSWGSFVGAYEDLCLALSK